MSVTTDMENDQTLRRYVLGELPRHKHRLIEKSFFEDDRLFDRLLSVEEQLIADYVHGELPEPERLRFESYFLTMPQRQQRVKEMFDAEVLEPASPPVRPPHVAAPPTHGVLFQLKKLWDWVRGSRTLLQVVYAVLTLAFLGGVWAALVRLNQSPRPAPGQDVTPPGAASPEVARVQMPQQPDANTAPPAATPSPEPSQGSSPQPAPKSSPRPPAPRETVTPLPPTGSAVAAILSPGLMRGESRVPVVKIMPDTPTVLLRASLTEKKYDFYSAVLLDEERRQVHRWRARVALSEGKTLGVVFDLSASGLVDGYYYLLLYGSGPKGAKVKVDTYPFQIERQ